MGSKPVVVAVVSLSLFILIGISYIYYTKSQYELSASCADAARQYFKTQFLNNSKPDPGTLAGYSNHYNFKLNKCFTLNQLNQSIKSENRIQQVFTLIDANESKEYGAYLGYGEQTPDICNVEKIKCDSLKKWKELSKPYMEQ